MSADYPVRIGAIVRADCAIYTFTPNREDDQ